MGSHGRWLLAIELRTSGREVSAEPSLKIKLVEKLSILKP